MLVGSMRVSTHGWAMPSSRRRPFMPTRWGKRSAILPLACGPHTWHHAGSSSRYTPLMADPSRGRGCGRRPAPTWYPRRPSPRGPGPHGRCSERISPARGILQQGPRAAARHRAAPTTVSPPGLPPGVASTRRVGASRAPGCALPRGRRGPRLLAPAAPGAANRHALAPRRPAGSPPRRAGENCLAISAHSVPAQHS